MKQRLFVFLVSAFLYAVALTAYQKGVNIYLVIVPFGFLQNLLGYSSGLWRAEQLSR